MVVRKEQGSKGTTDGQVKKIMRSLPRETAFTASGIAASAGMSAKVIERGLQEEVSSGRANAYRLSTPVASGYNDFKKLPDGARIPVRSRRQRFYVLK